MHLSRLGQKSFPRTTQDVNLLERTFGNLYGVSCVWKYFVGGIKTNKLSDGQQISHTNLPDKAIPPTLWNSCDYVLQFNFKIAYIAGSKNTAADFLSRLELKVSEKIRLKIREDLQTTPIEVTTSSSDVADEEQFFFAQADGEDETEEQTLERKKQSRQKATEWIAHEEPSSMKPSTKEITKIDGNTTSYFIHGNRANARIWLKQDVDLVLKNWKTQNTWPAIWWSAIKNRQTI